MAVEFGKYALLRKLGAGGMGQVFLARHAAAQGFEKLLVIKRLLPHLAQDDDFLPMFFDEARIAARLNHPNLIQIFELGEEYGSPYIAMEYVRGEDLRKLDRFARASGALIPLGPALRIIADAAAGLDYAHKAKDAHGQPLGLVHRDVSPQNILVGFDGAVKLIDFGVAKAAGRSQHTGTGILKGKYPYMSPEQAEGDELDHRSDIFALGVVLWEILTGKRLFKGESDLATMRLVTDCQVPPPTRIQPSLPKDIDALVLCALAKDRSGRYPDAGAFRLAIEEFLLSQRLAASSAHLVGYLAQLYKERLANEPEGEDLDELKDGVDLDISRVSTPASSRDWRDKATPGSSSNSKRVGSRSGKLAIQEGGTEALPEGRTRGTAPLAKVGAGGSRRTALGVLAAVVAIGAGAGTAAFLWPKPAAVHVDPQPVKVVVPVTPAPVEPPPVTPPPAAPQPVKLTLASEPPGASVEIAGQAIGTTPVEYSLDPAAPVEALFTLRGFEPQSAKLSAEAAPTLTVRLAKKRGADRRPSGGLGIKTDR